MTVKKEYAVDDDVWIYGVGVKNKLTKGKVIKIVDLSDRGWDVGPQYIVEIPTHIEPLLEIRSWENISQDDQGPVGMFRSIGSISSTIKKVKSTGFIYDDDYDEDDVDIEKIHAALEKSQSDMEHTPLDLKASNKPKRRYFKKKKQ